MSFILRNKNVFVIIGMRRSGNHAFVNWLGNSIEGKKCNWTDLNYNDMENRVLVSESGKTVFFNEANCIGLKGYEVAQAARLHKQLIAKCSNVVISLEDYIPQKTDFLVPRNSRVIIITRSTLNLIASRIKKAVSFAGLGLDQGDMRIDNRFFERLLWLYDSEGVDGNNKAKKWNYDNWLRSDDYRADFLEDIGLSFDLMPEISTQGGGSSFSGQLEIPSYESVSRRWAQIDWPDRVIDILGMDEYSRLLSKDEFEFIKEYKK